MAVSIRRLTGFGRWVLWLINAVVALALVATAGVIYLERGWVVTKELPPAEAFHVGTIVPSEQVEQDAAGTGDNPWLVTFRRLQFHRVAQGT